MNRFKEENYEYIVKRKKSYFGPATCREATYDCRVKKQYMQIVFEADKLEQLFDKIFEKFLKAIDHMEFHPTLGKEKKGTSYRLHRCSTKDRDASVIHQMRYLSPDDIEMLKQGNEIIQKRYLKLNNTKHRTKRFGLATWLLLTPPIKRVLPVKSTEQITEALKEVMLELEPASPVMKYRKYLQRQNTDDDDITTTKL